MTHTLGSEGVDGKATLKPVGFGSLCFSFTSIRSCVVG